MPQPLVTSTNIERQKISRVNVPQPIITSKNINRQKISWTNVSQPDITSSWCGQIGQKSVSGAMSLALLSEEENVSVAQPSPSLEPHKHGQESVGGTMRVALLSK